MRKKFLSPWYGFSRHPVAAKVQPPHSAAAASAWTSQTHLRLFPNLNWLRSSSKESLAPKRIAKRIHSCKLMSKQKAPCRPGLFLTITAYGPSGICNSSRTRWSSSWVRSASNSLVWRSCWLSFLRGCTLFAILIKNAQWLHVYSLQYLGCIEIHTVYI